MLAPSRKMAQSPLFNHYLCGFQVRGEQQNAGGGNVGRGNGAVSSSVAAELPHSLLLVDRRCGVGHSMALAPSASRNHFTTPTSRGFRSLPRASEPEPLSSRFQCLNYFSITAPSFLFCSQSFFSARGGGAIRQKFLFSI